MSRPPAKVRQEDIKRAINATKASGLPIARIEIDNTGKIVVIVGEPCKANEKETPEDITQDL